MYLYNNRCKEQLINTLKGGYKMTKAEKMARNMISKLSMNKLLDQWELTAITKDENIYIVRGWLMDEFEKRNAEAFEKWIDSENCDDFELRKYMIA